MRNKENIDADYLNMMLYNFEHSIKNNLDTVYLGYNIFENNPPRLPPPPFCVK